MRLTVGMRRRGKISRDAVLPDGGGHGCPDPTHCSGRHDGGEMSRHDRGNIAASDGVPPRDHTPMWPRGTQLVEGREGWEAPSLHME